MAGRDDGREDAAAAQKVLDRIDGWLLLPNPSWTKIIIDKRKFTPICQFAAFFVKQKSYLYSSNKMSEEEAKPDSAPSTSEGPNSRRRRGGGDKTCYNCGTSGHIARDCANPRLEGDARQVINKARAQYRRCFNCGKMGHISADCAKPAGNKSCYNCGKDGHIAKECSIPRSSE